MKTIRAICVTLLFSAACFAGSTPQQAARDWAATHLEKTDAPPFSFSIGNQPAANIIRGWHPRMESRQLDDHRVERASVWRDASGLTVRMVSVEYRDYPALEWTVYLKNEGQADSRLIDSLQGIDADIAGPANGEATVRYAKGSDAAATDYEVSSSKLGSGGKLSFASVGGRPTDGVAMPCFNFDCGGSGAILAIGWPGQWSATFERSQSSTHLRGGQELTHFKLKPGEEVRTPLIALLFHDGQFIPAQNVWRRWMVAHNLPRHDGQLMPTQVVSCSSGFYGEMIHANEENQKQFIAGFVDHGVPLDFWWMDAGWYVNNGHWENTGTWEVDRNRFPNGLRAITDFGRSKGVRSIVWFEPERVTGGTWLAKNHPEWILGAPKYGVPLASWSAAGVNGNSVVYNPANATRNGATATFLPKSVTLHPGEAGQRTVARWTAPADGDATINAMFSAADPKATTDVHVIAAGQAILDSKIQIDGKPANASVRKRVPLKSGDVIDFIVGNGNGTYFFDSTRLTATIEQRGKRYDVSADFQHGNHDGPWQFGYLPPGSSYEVGSFKKFDQDNSDGASVHMLLNLGLPQARQWLTDHVSKVLTDEGIDLYRQDFNIQPLSYWRNADEPDRQGITENCYVQGYLRYWDDLRKRFPKMWIDSCASGGRRNDLETLRRSVPLLRTDFTNGDAAIQQSFTYGISLWFPYEGTGTDWSLAKGGNGDEKTEALYWLRSKIVPSFMIVADMRRSDLDFDLAAQAVKQAQQIQPLMLGDFYPLRDYSRDDAVWMAWQFDDYANHRGEVQVFRRKQASEASTVLKLQGLEAGANYEVWTVDRPDQKQTKSGNELMVQGVTVSIAHQPGSEIYMYQKR